MRIVVLLALLIGSVFTAAAPPANTKITFFVEHEVDEQKDYLEILVDIKAEDTSLKLALVEAEETVKYVRNLIQQHCKTNSKKKGECHEIIDSGKFEVEPLYRIIRSEPVFIGIYEKIKLSPLAIKSPPKSYTPIMQALSSIKSTAEQGPILPAQSGKPSRKMRKRLRRLDRESNKRRSAARTQGFLLGRSRAYKKLLILSQSNNPLNRAMRSKNSSKNNSSQYLSSWLIVSASRQRRKPNDVNTPQPFIIQSVLDEILSSNNNTVLIKYLTATMQALLQDPSTIPFIHHSNINLNCLKQEIDRRMDKIRALISGSHHPNNPIPQLTHFGCQTDSLQIQQNQNNLRFKHRRVLSTFDDNVLMQDESVYNGRQSLPYRKKRFDTIESSIDEGENVNIRIRVSQYLTAKKQKEIMFSNLIKCQPSFESSNRKSFIKNSQDNQKPNLQHESHNSFQTVKSFIHHPSELPFTIPVVQNSDTQGLEQQEGRKSFSTIAKKQHSVRKTKITERTNLTENEVRIIVSEQCKAKALLELQKTICMKRKQPTDNKLRLNIIRKIEQRYGGYYSNI